MWPGHTCLVGRYVPFLSGVVRGVGVGDVGVGVSRGGEGGGVGGCDGGEGVVAVLSAVFGWFCAFGYIHTPIAREATVGRNPGPLRDCGDRVSFKLVDRDSFGRVCRGGGTQIV